MSFQVERRYLLLTIFTMRAIVIGFGLLILGILLLFKIAEINFIKGDVRLEIIVAIAAVVFFFVGLYFNYRKTEKQPVTMPSTNPSIVDMIITFGIHIGSSPQDYKSFENFCSLM